MVRADSAFFNSKFLRQAIAARVSFSVTCRQNKPVRRAIASIPDDAWTPIKYPEAVWDADEHRWVSDAEVAEIPFTCFPSKKKAHRVECRLVVRRVKRLNPTGQDSLFDSWRYHAFATDSELTTVDADQTHRRHAVIEQVNAELKANAVAHLPSGKYAANAAWAVFAVLAFNLARAAARAAHMAEARWQTLTARLVNIPARVVRHARKLALRLPAQWPWRHHWASLAETALGLPVGACP